MKVKLADLQIDSTIQIRRTNHEPTIQRYEEAFDKLPPVTVFDMVYDSASLGLRTYRDLHAERLDRGLSQEEIAEAIGVSRRVWQRAEVGLGVEPRNAKLIADYLGVLVTDVWQAEKAAA